MSKDNGGSAFPTMPLNVWPWGEGMTLRDYFAAQALIAKSFSIPRPSGADWAKDYAKEAYTQADAMLAERQKEGR